MTYRFRVLRQRKLLAAGAVLLIALPAALNVTLFSVLDAIVLRPLPYPSAARLVCLRSATGARFSSWSGTAIDSARQRSRSADAFAAFWTLDRTFVSKQGAEQVTAATMTASIFPMLGTGVMLGRPFLPEDETGAAPRVVLLAHDFWMSRYGGDPNVIGQPIRLTTSVYTIVGVLPSSFEFFQDLLRERPEVFLSLPRDPQWKQPYLWVLARLAPGVTVVSAQRELTALYQPPEHNGVTDEDRAVTVAPLLDAMNGSATRLLWLLLAAGMITVFIACLNVACLFRLRVVEERRDLAIRLALGARTGQLISHVLAQCAAFALVGTLCGALLAGIGLRLLVYLLPADLPLARVQHMHLDARAFGFALLLGVTSLVATAALPLFEVLRADLSHLIKPGQGQPSRFRRLRPQHVILALQTAGSTALLIGTFFLLLNFYLLASRPLGFEYSHVLTARVDLPRRLDRPAAEVDRFQSELIRRVSAAPGVVAAATTMGLPLQTKYPFRFDDADYPLPTSPPPMAASQSVSRGYFGTLRVPLLKGRPFRQDENCLSAFPIVINHAMAEAHWPGRNPLGHRITTEIFRGTRVYTIVGVSQDTLESVYQGQPVPTMYTCAPSDWTYLVVRTTGDPQTAARFVAQNARALEPFAAIGPPTSMSDMLAGSTARPRSQAILLAIFGVVAALLTVTGIYTAVAEWVARRAREMGIRTALGAKRSQVVRLVLGEAATLAFGGASAGLIGAVASDRILRSLVYGTKPIVPAVYVLVPSAFFAVILLAAWIPARRAAAVDPAIVLRDE